MKIGIIGLPYYALKLTRELNAFSEKHRYVHFDTYYSRKGKLRFLLAVNSLDAVVSINGSLLPSRVFSMVLKRGKKLIMNWSGTDVLHAIKAYNEGKYVREYYEKAIHICQAPWIRDELASIGIQATLIHFQYFDVQTIPQWQEFGVVTRIGASREQFYGIDAVFEAAKKCPDVPVIIAGIDGYEKPAPANVQYIGWTDRFAEWMKRFPVFLRLPEHDGLSTAVLEALAMGAYPLYKYDFPGAIQVCDAEDIADALQQFKVRFDRNELKPNEAGMDYIAGHHRKQEVLTAFENFVTKN